MTLWACQVITPRPWAGIKAPTVFGSATPHHNRAGPAEPTTSPSSSNFSARPTPSNRDGSSNNGESVGSRLGAFNVRGAQLITVDYQPVEVEAERLDNGGRFPRHRAGREHPALHRAEGPRLSRPPRTRTPATSSSSCPAAAVGPAPPVSLQPLPDRWSPTGHPSARPARRTPPRHPKRRPSRRRTLARRTR